MKWSDNTPIPCRGQCNCRIMHKAKDSCTPQKMGRTNQRKYRSNCPGGPSYLFLYVSCRFPIVFQCLPSVFPTCVIYVSYTAPICFLLLSHACPTCFLYVSYCFPRFVLYGSSVFLHVSYTFPICVLLFSHICPTCFSCNFLYVSYMCPIGFLLFSHICPTCCL